VYGVWYCEGWFYSFDWLLACGWEARERGKEKERERKRKSGLVRRNIENPHLYSTIMPGFITVPSINNHPLQTSSLAMG
jgi:hypothetical protein